ncbi:hypothetical protein [Streptomyces sclerotialus]|uniref:hypothetical protein n=1 Tax=Streptomyces sclerotialus TaxID=1957 RepID=UPI0004C63242
MTTPPGDCVVLDIPQGLRLDLLGLVVEVGRVRIVADRSGLLGNLIASLTCGGAGAAQSLEAMAHMLRSLPDGPAGEAGARRSTPEEQPARPEEQPG